MKRIVIVNLQTNTVANVVVVNDAWETPISTEIIYVANDWAGPGDWWEETEQRFYRALPKNVEEQAEATSEELP